MAVTASGVGTMSVYIGGTLMELTGKVDLEYGGITREPVVGPGGVISGRWMEKYKAATLSIEVSDGSQVDVVAFKDITFVPLQIAMRNGKTILIPNASCTGDVKGDLAGGKFTLEYFGDPAQDILPNG
jgi:hypothetical protein